MKFVLPHNKFLKSSRRERGTYKNRPPVPHGLYPWVRRGHHPPSPPVHGILSARWFSPHDERGIRWVRSIFKVRRHTQYL